MQFAVAVEFFKVSALPIVRDDLHHTLNLGFATVHPDTVRAVAFDPTITYRWGGIFDTPDTATIPPISGIIPNIAINYIRHRTLPTEDTSTIVPRKVVHDITVSDQWFGVPQPYPAPITLGFITCNEATAECRGSIATVDAPGIVISIIVRNHIVLK